MDRNLRLFSCRIFVLLAIILGAFFILAVSYDVAPSSAEAGGIISLLTFNVSNTTVAPNYTNFTNVTIGLIGTASIGNITNATISDGTTTYYNDSFTASPIVIILDHNFSTKTSVNWTVNFTLSSSTTWNVTMGANVTTIGNRTFDNISYSALPYASSLTPVTETTAPTASASCSPSSVNTGASFPCSCSGTDSGATASGVSTSSGSSTSNSVTSTSQTGTFTYTCTVTDNAGNSASSTATYTVEQTSGSVTPTPTWTTHSITAGIFEQGYTRELGVKNRIKVQIEAEDHFIGVVSLSGSQATIEISSDPVQVILDAGEDAKVDVTDDSFYDVYVLLNGITNNKANVTIQKIHEEVPEGGTGVETTGTGEQPLEEEEEERGISAWVWILIAVIIIVIIFWQTKKTKKK